MTLCESLSTFAFAFRSDSCARNFEEKVSKKDYPSYYKTIAKPTSISDVRALVQKDSIQDWDSLAREVRLIWDNAKQFNEEQSPIYDMAEVLDVSLQFSPYLLSPPRSLSLMF